MAKVALDNIAKQNAVEKNAKKDAKKDKESRDVIVAKVDNAFFLFIFLLNHFFFDRK